VDEADISARKTVGWRFVKTGENTFVASVADLKAALLLE